MKIYTRMEYIPNRLNPFVSCKSTEVEFSERSHFPTTMQEPHSTVRSMTVDPASRPIPITTWDWAVSLLPESPDTETKHDLLCNYIDIKVWLKSHSNITFIGQ